MKGDDWATALQELACKRIDTVPKNCLTLDQFRKRIGVASETTARMEMRKLIAAGRVEKAGKFRVEPGGTRILHYRLKKK